MATTTRVNLRKALSEAIGDYQAFATTADGNDAKTSLVSSTLKNYSGGADDGAFEVIVGSQSVVPSTSPMLLTAPQLSFKTPWPTRHQRLTPLNCTAMIQT